MQTNTLKTYAPKARRDFIAAVTRRAALFGLSAERIAEAREEGELLVIDGQAHPRRIARQRARLAERIRAQGFEPVMEAAAYTWFNRLIAIRYMELHGFLDHSYRVLSHPAAAGATGALPEILEQAQHVELPGLERERVIALKMDGTQDETLYRELLLAQCRALHQAMPFLFEPVDDETELLLPDRLLQTDSLIRELVSAIPEADWQQIEIIGWLYQFYISEKKDQVIGKVVKSEDIPAATQLFTPNWIVKYMVQNSLGAQWLATYPDSPLKAQMAYYIEPAEQTPEVQAQLDAITPDSLDPEALTLMDPACGSGHILVEAYELFKAIYLERGYRLRDIPKLILEKNLFGLDIDPRAAQLAGFALMMKAREDDRRVLERGVALNVMALEESGGLRSEEVKRLGIEEGIAEAVDELVELFPLARTFGSLIQVPEGLAARFPDLHRLCERETSDLFFAEGLRQLWALVRQAELLIQKYDLVVMNPPYMGSKGMNSLVKEFTQNHFSNAKQDLFACFIERGYILAKEHGRIAMITMQNWMFLSSFQEMREQMLRTKTIATVTQIGYNSFPSMNSKIAQASTFSIQNSLIPGFAGTFIDLNRADQSADKQQFFLSRNSETDFVINPNEFRKIPGSQIAYWASEAALRAFDKGLPLGNNVEARIAMATGDNARFVRTWPEVDINKTGLGIRSNEESIRSGKKWFPCNKGGDFRKWFGNNEYLVNWLSGGIDIKAFVDEETGRVRSHNYNGEFAFKESLTWSAITSGNIGVRYSKHGSMFVTPGSSAFATVDSIDIMRLQALLASCLVDHFLRIISSTVNIEVGSMLAIPYFAPPDRAEDVAQRAVTIANIDWDTYERSWDFKCFPILGVSTESSFNLESSYSAWLTKSRETIAEMKRLEEQNNRLFIDAYGLQDELTPEVPIDQITLTVNPAYRYGKKLSDDDWSLEHGFPEELETRFREDSMQELVSYAIGCMMGRYSLDEPGLIYAHSGNQGFDPSRYPTFPADDDGILPITDTDWFEDDATNRLVEFIAVAWDKAHLEDNLRFLADNLSPKRGEAPRDTLRRYLADKFFKDHLQTYKKRPIYWCFSSGKHKAFQCLVYLHRYHEGTLARMRMEYVVPLQSKMAARIDSLADDIEAASSGAQAKRLQKERDKLGKQLDELRRFDEQLRHHADQRIALDLDDGVKVNYGKFGDLLAEVKAVTGKKSD